MQPNSLEDRSQPSWQADDVDNKAVQSTQTGNKPKFLQDEDDLDAGGSNLNRSVLDVLNSSVSSPPPAVVQPNPQKEAAAAVVVESPPEMVSSVLTGIETTPRLSSRVTITGDIPTISASPNKTRLVLDGNDADFPASSKLNRSATLDVVGEADDYDVFVSSEERIDSQPVNISSSLPATNSQKEEVVEEVVVDTIAGTGVDFEASYDTSFISTQDHPAVAAIQQSDDYDYYEFESTTPQTHSNPNALLTEEMLAAIPSDAAFVRKGTMFSVESMNSMDGHHIHSIAHSSDDVIAPIAVSTNSKSNVGAGGLTWDMLNNLPVEPGHSEQNKDDMSSVFNEDIIMNHILDSDELSMENSPPPADAPMTSSTTPSSGGLTMAMLAQLPDETLKNCSREDSSMNLMGFAPVMDGVDQMKTFEEEEGDEDFVVVDDKDSNGPNMGLPVQFSVIVSPAEEIPRSESPKKPAENVRARSQSNGHSSGLAVPTDSIHDTFDKLTKQAETYEELQAQHKAREEADKCPQLIRASTKVVFDEESKLVIEDGMVVDTNVPIVSPMSRQLLSDIEEAAKSMEHKYQLAHSRPTYTPELLALYNDIRKSPRGRYHPLPVVAEDRRKVNDLVKTHVNQVMQVLGLQHHKELSRAIHEDILNHPTASADASFTEETRTLQPKLSAGLQDEIQAVHVKRVLQRLGLGHHRMLIKQVHSDILLKKKASEQAQDKLDVVALEQQLQAKRLEGVLQRLGLGHHRMLLKQVHAELVKQQTSNNKKEYTMDMAAFKQQLEAKHTEAVVKRLGKGHHRMLMNTFKAELASSVSKKQKMDVTALKQQLEAAHTERVVKALGKGHSRMLFGASKTDLIIAAESKKEKREKNALAMAKLKEELKEVHTQNVVKRIGKGHHRMLSGPLHEELKTRRSTDERDSANNSMSESDKRRLATLKDILRDISQAADAIQQQREPLPAVNNEKQELNQAILQAQQERSRIMLEHRAVLYRIIREVKNHHSGSSNSSLEESDYADDFCVDDNISEDVDSNDKNVPRPFENTQEEAGLTIEATSLLPVISEDKRSLNAQFKQEYRSRAHVYDYQSMHEGTLSELRKAALLHSQKYSYHKKSLSPTARAELRASALLYSLRYATAVQEMKTMDPGLKFAIENYILPVNDSSNEYSKKPQFNFISHSYERDDVYSVFDDDDDYNYEPSAEVSPHNEEPLEMKSDINAPTTTAVVETEETFDVIKVNEHVNSKIETVKVEEAVVAEPVVQEAKVLEPAVEEAVVVEPVVEEPVVVEPVVEEPVVVEPVVEEAVVQEAKVLEPAVEEAVVLEPAVEEAIVVEPVVVEPVVVEPAVEEPVVVEKSDAVAKAEEEAEQIKRLALEEADAIKQLALAEAEVIKKAAQEEVAASKTTERVHSTATSTTNEPVILASAPFEIREEPYSEVSHLAAEVSNPRNVIVTREPTNSLRDVETTNIYTTPRNSSKEDIDVAIDVLERASVQDHVRTDVRPDPRAFSPQQKVQPLSLGVTAPPSSNSQHNNNTSPQRIKDGLGLLKNKNPSAFRNTTQQHVNDYILPSTSHHTLSPPHQQFRSPNQRIRSPMRPKTSGSVQDSVSPSLLRTTVSFQQKVHPKTPQKDQLHLDRSGRIERNTLSPLHKTTSSTPQHLQNSKNELQNTKKDFSTMSEKNKALRLEVRRLQTQLQTQRSEDPPAVWEVEKEKLLQEMDVLRSQLSSGQLDGSDEHVTAKYSKATVSFTVSNLFPLLTSSMKRTCCKLVDSKCTLSLTQPFKPYLDAYLASAPAVEPQHALVRLEEADIENFDSFPVPPVVLKNCVSRVGPCSPLVPAWLVCAVDYLKAARQHQISLDKEVCPVIGVWARRKQADGTLSQENVYLSKPGDITHSIIVDLSWDSVRVVVYDVCPEFGAQDADVLATASIKMHELRQGHTDIELRDFQKTSFSSVITDTANLRKRYYNVERIINNPTHTDIPTLSLNCNLF